MLPQHPLSSTVPFRLETLDDMVQQGCRSRHSHTSRPSRTPLPQPATAGYHIWHRPDKPKSDNASPPFPHSTSPTTSLISCLRPLPHVPFHKRNPARRSRHRVDPGGSRRGWRGVAVKPQRNLLYLATPPLSFLSVIRVRKRLIFHSLSVTQPSWKITLFFASFRSTRQATHLAQVDEGDGSPGDLR